MVDDGEAGRDELVSGNDLGNEANGDNEEGVGTEFWATKFRRRLGGDILLYLWNSGRGLASAGLSEVTAIVEGPSVACRAISRSTIMFGNISNCVCNVITWLYLDILDSDREHTSDTIETTCCNYILENSNTAADITCVRVIGAFEFTGVI